MAKEQRKIIRTLFEEAQNNENSIKDLSKIEINNNPVAFNNKIQELVIFSHEYGNLDFAYNLLTINQLFENFPEWMIPFTYIKLKYYSEDGNELVDASFRGRTRYYWKEMSENNWLFQFSYYNVSSIRPIYFDLSLFFNNPRNYYEI